MSGEPKSMRDLHRIREQIYEEEKHLTPEQRIARIRQESDAFLKRAGLKLKRVSPPASTPTSQ